MTDTDDIRYIRENMVSKGELLPWKDDVQRQLGAAEKETAAVETRLNLRVDGVLSTVNDNQKTVKAAASARVNMWIVGGISLIVSAVSFMLSRLPWP